MRPPRRAQPHSTVRDPQSAGRGFLGLWAPVLFYMAAIFSVSSLPAPPLPSGVSDKPAHSLVYTGLASLMLRALVRARWAGVTWRPVAGAVLLTTLYAASDELHQSFVPGREADVGDLAADVIGATVGAIVLWTWSIIRPVRTRSDTQ